jgi:hypothetical protein
MSSLHTARRSRAAVELVTLLVVIALAFGIQCGRESPGAPSPSTVSKLALVPHTEQLVVGAVVDLTLQATMLDGSIAILSPEWGTDSPDVLLVRPLSTSRTDSWPDEKVVVVDHYLRGQVTAQSPGVATVFADCPYGRGQQVIRVVAR